MVTAIAPHPTDVQAQDGVPSTLRPAQGRLSSGHRLEAVQGIARWMRYHDGIRPQDAEDFVSDVVLEVMERISRNGGDFPTEEIWRAARCVRSRYRRAYARGRPRSLSDPVPGTEGIALSETLAGPDDDVDAWLDARARLEALPPGVLRIAHKLEKGDPLTPRQKAYLARFRRDGKEANARERTWARERYRRRRALGLCVVCGGPSGDGFARCPSCRERFRAFQALHKRRKGLVWQAKLRDHWRKQGRCPRCGRAPAPGRKKCPLCLAKDREYLRTWRSRQAQPVQGCPAAASLEGQEGARYRHDQA